MSLKNSLYAKYMAERQGAKIIETEHGFAVFRIVGEELFLVEMFVEQSARGVGKAHGLVALLEEEAHESGCKIITANIHLNDHNANDTLTKALRVGFKVQAANNGVLLILKNVEE